MVVGRKILAGLNRQIFPTAETFCSICLAIQVMWDALCAHVKHNGHRTYD